MPDDVAVTAPPPSSAPTGETREQRAWYFYDWANSAYVTTTATVLLSPYLTTVATDAACPGLSEGQKCLQTLDVVGIPVDPGSLFAYTATVSTIISALVLIVVGGIADRSRRPTTLFAGFAWVGAAAACLMFIRQRHELAARRRALSHCQPLSRGVARHLRLVALPDRGAG